MVNDISILGRNTSGVKLINMDKESDIVVASFAKVRESETASEEEIIKNLEEELDDVDPDDIDNK